MIRQHACRHGQPISFQSTSLASGGHHNRAPTSTDLPTTPTKRTWKSYFRSSPTSRGSVDGDNQIFDHEISTPKQSNGKRQGCPQILVQSEKVNNSWHTDDHALPTQYPTWQSGRDITVYDDYYAPSYPQYGHIVQQSVSNGSSHRSEASHGKLSGSDIPDIVNQINESLSLRQATGPRSIGSRSRSRASTIHTTNSDAISIDSSRTSQSTHSKRSRGQDDDDDKDMLDPDDRKGKKPRDQSPVRQSGPTKLFACPYAKNDPLRYSHKNMSEPQYRNCCSGNWPDIPRLKQHLYRAHGRSNIDCRRCWQNFEREDARTKHEKEQKCAIRGYPEERMNDKQRESIGSKKKGPAHDLWNEIYKTLFPGTPLPSSPYAELVVGEDLRASFRYMEQVLPQLMLDHVTASLKSESNEYDVLANLIGGLIIDAVPFAVRMAREKFANENQITHILPPIGDNIATDSQQSDSMNPQNSEAASSFLPMRPKPTQVQPVQTDHGLHSDSIVATDTQAQPPPLNTSRASLNHLQLKLFDSTYPMASSSLTQMQISTGSPLTTIYHDVSHMGSSFNIPQSPFAKFAEPNRGEYPFPVLTDQPVTPVAHAVRFDDQVSYRSVTADEHDEAMKLDENSELDEFNSFSDGTGMELFFLIGNNRP